jgi:hypothetical protein
MATTKKAETKATDSKKPRKQRTPDQIVADLEAKIADVKKRAAAKKVRQTDEGKALFAAAKALDKATKAAADAGNGTMQKATEAARAVLAEAMIEMGVRVPEGRRTDAA